MTLKERAQNPFRLADDHWIQKAVPKKNKGLLHKKLDVPGGEKIPEDKLEGALHSDNDKLREEAQFAENMKGLHHGTTKQAVGFDPVGGPGTGGPMADPNYHPDNYQICQNCGSDHADPSGFCPDCGQGDPNTPVAPYANRGQQVDALRPDWRGMQSNVHSAIPGAHDPNHFDPYAEEDQGYNEMGGGDPELIAALQLEYPGASYEQLMAMAERQNQMGPETTPIDPNAGWGNGYGEYGDIPGGPGQSAYASVHESIKSDMRDRDSIEEHMDWPAQIRQSILIGRHGSLLICPS
jgi:hypothetical protein